MARATLTEAPDDETAIRISEAWQEGWRMELWQRERRVKVWSDPPQPD